MAWAKNAKPTPANIRKRLAAAVAALESAEELATRNGSKLMRKVAKEAKNGRAWADSAYRAAHYRQ